MFDIGFGEFVVIAIVALFVIGPERLPRAAAQAGRMLRELRAMATGARQELSEHLDLDPELKSLDLQALDPRRFDPRRAINDLLRDDGPAAGPDARPESLRSEGLRSEGLRSEGLRSEAQ